MNNRKIVFFDIDGTIYRYDIGIPKDIFESIQQLKENGHIPVICTGRTKCMLYKEFLRPGFDYLICGGGTYIEENGKQSFHYQMDYNESQKVIKKMLQNGFVPVAEARDYIYIGTEIEDLTVETKKVNQTYYDKMPDRIKTLDELEVVSKISAMFTTKSDEEAMITEFGKEYSIINHNNNLLELIPKPYNKALGIEKLINNLGISKENTYAFGDSFNDIDMLQYVKYGCAMGNSHPDLFSYVPYRTEEFDQGGITNALKRFGLIK